MPSYPASHRQQDSHRQLQSGRRGSAWRLPQFTSIDFIKALKDADIKISMDGKGAWRDNVLVKRLWRRVKYEEVYLHAYHSVSAARGGLARYLTFYNARRPHSSLDGQTPDQAYQFKPQPVPVAA